jgi:uncharacterized protein (DUF1501 family)
MAHFTRREGLFLAGAFAASSVSGLSFAQGIESRKFIFVMLRGAMDGLSALMPDDDRLDAVRASILPDKDTRLDLGNGFRLHPQLAGLNKLYQSGDAAFIPASATSHRDRSHFEAQDALETLGKAGAKDGWLNRALQHSDQKGLFVGRAVPLAFKGKAPVTNWSPPMFDTPSDQLLERLSDLYSQDMTFAASLEKARSADSFDMQTSKRESRRFSKEYSIALSSIGKMMSAENGPGIGMAALDGWDTHAGQENDLNRKFSALNEGLMALKKSLGKTWSKTCIVVCSEFGRTVAANGTKGTDHGTGGLVMLMGGAVKGGQVLGDWPGLKSSDLYEGRDLFPANDISAILKGVLRDHLGVDKRALDQSVFPNSARGFDGLVRS